jgi:hypothetical protein
VTIKTSNSGSNINSVKKKIKTLPRTIILADKKRVILTQLTSFYDAYFDISGSFSFLTFVDHSFMVVLSFLFDATKDNSC